MQSVCKDIRDLADIVKETEPRLDPDNCIYHMDITKIAEKLPKFNCNGLPAKACENYARYNAK